MNLDRVKLTEKQLYTYSNYIGQLIPISSTYVEKESLIVVINPSDLLLVISFLKSHSDTQYVSLSAISGVDYPHRNSRFEVVYELLSLRFTHRLRIKVFVDEVTDIMSLVSIFKSSTWWEREIWDLYGVFFSSNNEMRRILTDYGFEGHPMRKDFPLSGYVETRYDDRTKRVVCEPIEHAQEFRLFEFTSNWDEQTLLSR